MTARDSQGTLDRLQARIANLEVDYARAEKIAVSLHATTKKAMDRIAELEAEIAQRDSNWARNLAGDLIAAGESEYAPDPRAARIAELEAENTRLKTAVTEWGDAAHRQAAEVARLTAALALPIPSPPAEEKTS